MIAAHGVSYDDLAGMTGCAVGTVKSRVSRARHQPGAMLDGAGGRSADARERRLARQNGGARVSASTGHPARLPASHAPLPE